MYHLIIPVNFEDSYFFKNRPRWLLSLPDGKLMVEESIASVVKGCSKIIIVCPKEHFSKTIKEDSIINSLQKRFKKEVQIIKSEKKLTKAESIVSALKKAKITESFFVKDPLNKFNFNYKKNNVTFFNEVNSILDADFGFFSGDIFLEHYYELKKNKTNLNAILSSLKKSMHDFIPHKIKLVEDWSSLKNYREFQRRHATLFLDIDGTLLKNGSKFVDGAWETKPILKNLKAIAAYQQSHNLHIVITTSRPKSQKSYLQKVFSLYNIIVHSYLFDLPHCQRVLVNDFFDSNPYPSALAINIARNQDNLESYLDSILVT